jgi:hypothetical protein
MRQDLGALGSALLVAASAMSDTDLEETVQVLGLLLTEARAIARRCWAEWRLADEWGCPPGCGPSRRQIAALAEEYPWLAEEREAERRR